jgi:hypothetical protein
MENAEMTLEEWVAHYGTGGIAPPLEILLFGANSEVEDPLLRSRRRPVLVYDDATDRCTVLGSYAGRWEHGFARVRNSPDRHFWVVCGVCSTPKKRQGAINAIQAGLDGFTNWSWYGFTASTAIVSQWAKVDKTAMILDGAMLMANASLGAFSVLLPGAAVYHYSRVDDCSIVVGGAVVLGRAHIRHLTRVCAGAVILPGAKIGPHQTVGAGAIVKVQGDDSDDYMG